MAEPRLSWAQPVAVTSGPARSGNQHNCKGSSFSFMSRDLVTSPVLTRRYTLQRE